MKFLTFRNFVRIAYIGPLLVMLWGTQLWGQAAGGSLHGQVTDPSGAAVTKADVQVIASDGTITRTATTQTGTYEFKGVAPGTYGIKVDRKSTRLNSSH